MKNMISHIGYLFCCLAFCVPASAGTIYVDVDATGRNNGTSWSDAYTSLSAAIDAASAQDEIWVAEGTYRPVVMKNGVRVYGGFAGTESSVSAGDADAHKTYITGQGVSRAVESVGNDSSALLRGFYITEGFIDFPYIGGGVLLKDSDAMFVNCVFTGNRSTVMGGAVGIRGGSPTFVNCRFYGNDGGWAAGAVFNLRSGSTSFVNCLFYENDAWEAGAVSILTGAVTFSNCTLSANRASIGRGGALFDTLGEAVLHNCILWDNTSPGPGADEIFNLPTARGATTVTYSLVKGGWAGEGNIDSDPVFVDSAKHDYRLQEASPARDMGDNGSLPLDVGDTSFDGDTSEVLPKDLALNPRINGDSVEMGAFEWHAPGE